MAVTTMLETVLTQGFAFNREVLSGSVDVAVSVRQPAYLSHLRRQRLLDPWRGLKREDKLAYRPGIDMPRTSQAGRPDCALGVSGMGLTAGPASRTRLASRSEPLSQRGGRPTIRTARPGSATLRAS